MAGFTQYAKQAFLNFIVGKTAIFSLPTMYCALFTAVGDNTGAGFTEVTGGSYARVATSGTTWNSASGAAPATLTNANAITFASPTGTWGTIPGFGFFDAASSGNLLAWDYLGPYSWNPVSISSASPAVWTMPGHGFIANDQVVFTEEYGDSQAPTLAGGSGALTGLLTVLSPATDTFTLENGATAINTTGTGNGAMRKVAPVTINSSSGAMSFAASQITFVF